MTPTVREAVEHVARRALREFVDDRVDERLTSALKREAAAGEVGGEAEEQGGASEAKATGIVTTDEEREGFLIVKAILREVTDVNRIAMRDAKTYCSILLDNNNRKPICRFHFNTRNWYLSTFDAEKNESRHSIESLDEIFGYAQQLTAVVFAYDKS